MKSVALHNLGCKVNAYELEVIGQKLQKKGYFIVPFEGKADIYIVNTCTVTNIADRKSRQMLHRAKKRNPDAIVVAVGCYVQNGSEEKLLDESIDLAVGNNRKKDLPEILAAFLKERETGGTNLSLAGKTLHHTSIVDIAAQRDYEEMGLMDCREHTRAYIKIQDGCNQFCSYCIIPYVRGRVRSRRQEDILAEVASLAERGYKEVVLTGIHISSYGMDFAGKAEGDYLTGDKGGTALLNLIRSVSEVNGISRIRLGSLEPRIITEKFAEGLAGLTKVCPHFHLSLQSGCDRTLKRMNRHYTAGEYSDRVKILRSAFFRPAITTDVIVGFPQETEEEFRETECFLREMAFYEMHVFKYSAREGTVAAAMQGQIPESIKSERSAVLLALEKEQSNGYRRDYIGKKIRILTEDTLEKKGHLYRVGHTETYVKAAFPIARRLSNDGYLPDTGGNQLVEGRAAGFLEDEILLMDI